MIPNEDEEVQEEVQEELNEDLSHDPDNLMACLAIQMTAVLDTLEHLQDGEALFHTKWADISRLYMDIQARLDTLFND